MARPALPALMIAATLLLLLSSLVIGAVAGPSPGVWVLLAVGAAAMAATAVALARAPAAFTPPAPLPPAEPPATVAADDGSMARAERLAAVGRLAAGVAHEVNNPLTGVLTYTHLLLDREDLPQEIRADLERIARATERVREIVKRLLDFARERPERRATVDLNTLIRETLELVQRSAQLKGVDLTFRPDPALPAVTLDASGLQTVVLNLILNALDSTRQGDRILVSTSAATSEGTDAVYPREGVQIQVVDTGAGISPQNLGRIFDPFFSTKEQGTGLGLSVSLAVVQEHGGDIRVSSVVGAGTTFVVWIPSEGGG